MRVDIPDRRSQGKSNRIFLLNRSGEDDNLIYLAVEKNHTAQRPYWMIQSMETVQKYYRVDRREISFLKFIIEAYDGTALVRTIDPETGTVALHIAPGCEPVVEMVLHDLKNEILLEDLNRAVNLEGR